MNRLFVAIDLPEELKELLYNRIIENFSGSKIRWEKKEKLHLTLKFLGDTSEEKTKDVINRIEKIAANYKKLNLEIDRSGLFKVKEQPKIIWIGLKENKALTSLYYSMQREFETLGYESDKRKFKPHITIARLKGFENLSQVKELGQLIGTHSFEACSIKLFKSKLFPTGSVYTVLKEIELK